MVNLALKYIEPLLSSIYAADIKGGRPNIAQEKLLRAMLLQIFYSIRRTPADGAGPMQPAVSRYTGLSVDDMVWVPGAVLQTNISAVC
jgi:hypothetical protein